MNVGTFDGNHGVTLANAVECYVRAVRLLRKTILNAKLTNKQQYYFDCKIMINQYLKSPVSFLLESKHFTIDLCNLLFCCQVYKNINQTEMDKMAARVRAIDVIRVLKEMDGDEVRDIESDMCNEKTGFEWEIFMQMVLKSSQT